MTMKSLIVIIVFVASIISVGYYCVSNLNIVYALCTRDIEYSFVIVDHHTRTPIVGAAVTIISEDTATPSKIATTVYVSDAEGNVKVLRKQEMCEDVIRPFRKTVTLINRTWGSIKVEHGGYQTVDEITFHELKLTDHGYFEAEKLQRVSFVIPLAKINKQ